jgi:hypothetical protein
MDETNLKIEQNELDAPDSDAWLGRVLSRQEKRSGRERAKSALPALDAAFARNYWNSSKE